MLINFVYLLAKSGVLGLWNVNFVTLGVWPLVLLENKLLLDDICLLDEDWVVTLLNIANPFFFENNKIQEIFWKKKNLANLRSVELLEGTWWLDTELMDLFFKSSSWFGRSKMLSFRTGTGGVRMRLGSKFFWFGDKFPLDLAFS